MHEGELAPSENIPQLYSYLLHCSQSCIYCHPSTRFWRFAATLWNTLGSVTWPSEGTIWNNVENVRLPSAGCSSGQVVLNMPVKMPFKFRHQSTFGNAHSTHLIYLLTQLFLARSAIIIWENCKGSDTLQRVLRRVTMQLKNIFRGCQWTSAHILECSEGQDTLKGISEGNCALQKECQ